MNKRLKIGAMLLLVLMVIGFLLGPHCDRDVRHDEKGTWIRCPEIKVENWTPYECWWLAEPKEELNE